MKKIICKKTYDTEVATVVCKTVSGTFGDPTGYEQTLYQMPDGAYFLYENGGVDSAFPKEDIKRVSKQNAEKWITEHK